MVRPDQIAEPDIQFPDWPRPDLNVACLEFLIGLVFMADPARDKADWRSRRLDPARLREKLAPLAPAFDLAGDGPRFLQDLEPLDGDPHGPDMLFIDSAGGQTARNNADLMVRRDRYASLDPAMAAMALYTLQSQAPSGGAGNRTSMRGGGPMITLADPGGSLADLVWANVPYGAPQGAQALPWMRPTRVSKEKGSETPLPEDEPEIPAETFFGMPRRLRLVWEGDRVVGVIQRPYGTNYLGWSHPLSPYYRVKEGAELLPVHPRAGRFGYRNWLGVVAAEEDPERKGLRLRAAALNAWQDRSPNKTGSVLVAGWAMDNMKPRDFVFSRQPFPAVDARGMRAIGGLVRAAETLSAAMRYALQVPLESKDGARLEAEREAFFLATEATFLARVRDLEAGAARADVGRRWLSDMRAAALEIFDRHALPALADRQSGKVADIVAARGQMLGAFAGHGKLGRNAYDHLTLPLPEKTPRTLRGSAA